MNQDMIEDEPVPAENNDSENINFNREETIIEDTPQEIKQPEEQESPSKLNDTISGMDY